MKISKLLKCCTYNDSIMEEFTTCHPKQIISDFIPVPVWKIKYKYNTIRGNMKTAIKYLFLSEDSWDCIPNEFQRYVSFMNKSHPERKLSNVEILDSDFLGEIYIPLE